MNLNFTQFRYLFFTASITFVVVYLLLSFSPQIKTRRLLNDEVLIAANQQYTIKEENLRIQLENYETLHSEYHEYCYDLDAIEHSQQALIAILTALHGDNFSFADTQASIDLLFEKQYTLTETIQTTRRYVKGRETDYMICTVKLENRSLEQAAPLLLNGEQYRVYIKIMEYFASN